MQLAVCELLDRAETLFNDTDAFRATEEFALKLQAICDQAIALDARITALEAQVSRVRALAIDNSRMTRAEVMAALDGGSDSCVASYEDRINAATEAGDVLREGK